MRLINKIKTNDGREFDDERQAKLYLQNKAEPLFRDFFRDFDTLSSVTVKLLFMQDNAKKLQELLNIMHELNEGLKNE